MQLLMGAMSQCSDPQVELREQCNGVQNDGFQREWRAKTFTYDWIGAGIITTFVLILNESGWIDIVYDTVDSTGLHTGPYEWANAGIILPALFSVTVIGFLFMKIYTAIFVQFYSEVLINEKKANLGETQLSVHANSTKIRRRNLPILVEEDHLRHKAFVKGTSSCLFMRVCSFA
jgi:hypothetical protein